MKPKTMILMVVAVVCGLGASYMTSRLLAERDDQPPPPVVAAPQEVPKVKLLVAKKPLALGQVVRKPKELFQEKPFSVDDAPKDAIRDWKDLEGKTLSRGLRAGDHVCTDDVRDGPATLKVPTGLRAVGVRVDQEMVASGFAALPGSRVDVIWTTRGNTTDNTESITLLQRVEVLAADMIDVTPDARAVVASVVTLALTPHDARRVTLAKQNGTLCFFLRGPQDDAKVKDERVTVTTLLGRDKKEKEEAKEPVEVTEKVPEAKEEEPDEPKWEPIPAPKVRKHVVWMRSGDKQWKEEFEIPDEEGDAEETFAAGGAVWSGSETLQTYGRLTFHLLPGKKALMDDRDGRQDGSWEQSGNQITLRFYSGTVVYTGTVNGSAMSGSAFNGRQRWSWTVRRQGAPQAAGAPAPGRRKGG